MQSAVRTFALSLLLGSVACAAPRADATGEEKAIRDIVTNWNAQLAARNDSVVAAFYGEGAVLFPPNEPRITGAANIRQFWAALWPLNATLTFSTVSVKVASSGDLAVEEGSYAFAAPGMPNDAGKYLVVWQKQGGQWKVIQDSWNSDAPMPPAVSAAPAT